MDNILDKKDIKKPKELGKNNDYFKYIFKKTEKIICAVFYITESFPIEVKDSLVVRTTNTTAGELLDVVIESLGTVYKDQERILDELSLTLLELESRLRVLHASRYISAEHLLVFVNEIDTVLRSIPAYTKADKTEENITLSEGGSKGEVSQMIYGGLPEEKSPSIRATTKQTPTVQGQNRQVMILDVLRNKGQASIKDISTIITDCSEKTIQRELNNLIKDSKVVRKGERRWSRYSLSNSD